MQLCITRVKQLLKSQNLIKSAATLKQKYIFNLEYQIVLIYRQLISK